MAITAVLDFEQRQKPSHSAVGLEESVITMSMGPRPSRDWVLKFRHLFVEVPDNDLGAFFNHPDRQPFGLDQVSPSSEYFEDENGKPISIYEMIGHSRGEEFPIIIGDPKSVLRLGPIAPREVVSWTVDKANAMGQFLDVVTRIHASAWFREPHSLTTVSTKDQGSELLEAIFPNDAATMSILAYFRQLHGGDKLLLKACDAYLATSATAASTGGLTNGKKRLRTWWIPLRSALTR